MKDMGAIVKRDEALGDRNINEARQRQQGTRSQIERTGSLMFRVPRPDCTQFSAGFKSQKFAFLWSAEVLKREVVLICKLRS